MEVLKLTFHEIHLKVEVNANISYLLSTIHVESSINAKNTLWDNLAYLGSLHSLLCLVARDFNDITSPIEEYDGNQTSINKCLSFSKKFSICTK